MLRSVQYVIVDEIHALVPSKRGTFLSLLLERLDALALTSPIRIGLSATQRPLELVAGFLAGLNVDGVPRPISIVDAGMRKNLDLAVISPVDDMKKLPRLDGAGPTIWPSIHVRLLDLVAEHTSTLVFANNRRLVERIAADMNRLAGHDLVRAHHGSVSKEHRHEIERELKGGRLPALVATSSLELGIDVGAIDLVCQVETPVSVASALQRVGRAGHLYRRTSKGRLLPKTRDDLLRMAAVARAMLRGEISAVRAPENALDVLAQQIVAMVALDPWTVDALYARIRQAYPYRNLPRKAFTSVLDLLSGRYRSPVLSALRPRVAWDRARDVLETLPGSRHAAILNGGTIPETGQFPMVLGDGKTKLGELDEEFVFERRLGQTILLGTSRWRILEIGADRVIVAPSEESEAVLPFWKGDGLGHDAEFGRSLGRFVRECQERISSPDIEAWLSDECALDGSAAANLATYVRDQLARGGALPNDRTILLDAFRNEADDPRVAVLTPFGRAFHLAFLLAVQGTLREEGQEPPQAVFSNVGILFRPGRIPVDTLISAMRSLRPDEVEERIMHELEQTPFFALRFRRNAARALLLPRVRPGQRTPLWLQRLRARDLLEYARAHRAFPIIAETYREILEDLLPLNELGRFLEEVAQGEARFAVRRDLHPSPFSSSLLLEFTAEYLYGKDELAPARREARFDRAEMVALLRAKGGELPLDPDALATLDERLQGVSAFDRARDGVELVDLLRRIGDLTEDEVSARSEPAALDALPKLIGDGRIVRVAVPGAARPDRLVSAEDAARYERWGDADVKDVVKRFVSTHSSVSRAEILARYPEAESQIEDLVTADEIAEIVLPNGESSLAEPAVIAGARRLTLARRRRRFRTVPAAALARSILRRQHVLSLLSGDEGLREVVAQLVGCFLPIDVWSDVLMARVDGFHQNGLDRLVREGAVTWCGRAATRGGRSIAFAPPDETWMLGAPQTELAEKGEARRVLDYLEVHGASFLHQMAGDLNEAPSHLAETLWSLIWAGWASNDSLAPAWGGKPDPSRWGGRRQIPWGGGRWSMRCVSGSERTEDEDQAALRIMLDRYGLLSRELVERESLGLRWRGAYPMLSRMEWGGDLDRGLFVDDLSGLQFAATGAAAAMSDEEVDDEMILVHASDPANVWGDVFPILRPDGERYALRHHLGNYLVLQGGRRFSESRIGASAWSHWPISGRVAGEMRSGFSRSSFKGP